MRARLAVLAVAGLIAVLGVTAITASGAGHETEVRITAALAADGRIEFALQQREADDGWSERLLPRSRFFPATIAAGRWLVSTPLTVRAPGAGDDAEGSEVRITAQRVADGRTEFALQQRGEDGEWGERLLPRARFFPATVAVGRWLVSTPLTVSLPEPAVGRVSGTLGDGSAETVFVGAVSESRQVEFQVGVAELQAFYADVFSVPLTGFTTYVGASHSQLCETHFEVTTSLSCPGAWGWATVNTIDGVPAMFLYDGYGRGWVADSTPMAHEAMHVIQYNLSWQDVSLCGGGSWTCWREQPKWLIEAPAHLMQLYYRFSDEIGDIFFEHPGPRELIDDVGFWIEWRATQEEPIGTLRDGSSEALQAGRGLGMLAIARLTQIAGAQSHFRYAELVSQNTWQDAFQGAYGMSVQSFYDSFEALRGRLPSPRFIVGTLSEPGGKASPWLGVEAVRVDGTAPRTDTEFTASDDSGEFVIAVADGQQFLIRISVWDGEAWRPIGWYSTGGITTQRAEATPIDMEGASVGIDIRLPSLPADLPTID